MLYVYAYQIYLYHPNICMYIQMIDLSYYCSTSVLRYIHTDAVDDGEQLALPGPVRHPRLADPLRPGRHRPGRPGVIDRGTASNMGSTYKKNHRRTIEKLALVL